LNCTQPLPVEGATHNTCISSLATPLVSVIVFVQWSLNLEINLNVLLKYCAQY
jgi:hypothetical protein